MPKRVARSWLSSTLTLPILILPTFSSASSSSSGAIILHGPHQVAQKSTNTGVADLLTSCSKLSVERVTMCSFAMDILRLVSETLDATRVCFGSVRSEEHTSELQS